MSQTKSGVPKWAKQNAPETGQGEFILKTNELTFNAFLPCKSVDGLSKDKGDVTLIYDFNGELVLSDEFNLSDLFDS